jgi:hypothetical protein
VTYSVLASAPPLCDIGAYFSSFVTLVYMPAGRSVPEERTVRNDLSDSESAFDAIIDLAIAEAWERDEEPIEVRDPVGNLLWRSGRW